MLSRTNRTSLLFIGIAGLFGLVSYKFHRAVDNTRFETSIEDVYYFVPKPESVRLGAMGYHTMFGDLLWVRTVLLFADTIHSPRPEAVELLRAMLLTVSTLDPRWRSSHFYGGGMLRVNEDYDGSDEIYRRGMEGLPDDPFFPFSLGMNCYLHRKDVECATKYLRIASRLPDAPKWYRAAAAGFMNDEGRTQAALNYLEEEMKVTKDPEALEVLQESWRRTLEEFFSRRIEDSREKFRIYNGRDIESADELGQLPQDPYGAGWVISVDGTVRSKHVDAKKAREARKAEKRLLTTQWDGSDNPLGPM